MEVTIEKIALLPILLIILVNYKNIQLIRKRKWTFINTLICIDCIQSILHIILLAVYFRPQLENSYACIALTVFGNFIASAKRILGFLIAFYRYLLVFAWALMNNHRKWVQKICIFMMIIYPYISAHAEGIFADKTSRRYSMCMGLKFEGSGFHDIPDDHPFIILQKMMFLMPTCLTPYFYLKIFFFRYFNKETFLDKQSIKRRKISNIVSFSYNMLIWISDLCALIMVLFLQPLVTSSLLLHIIPVVFIGTTCGLTPLIYYFVLKYDELNPSLFCYKYK